MEKPALGGLGRVLFAGVLILGCNAPDDDKEAVTQKTSALTTVLFQPFVTYPIASSTKAVAVGDLNGDGRSDVAVTTSNTGLPNPDDHKLHVYLQANDGSLQPAVKYPLGNRPESVDIGDVNGDGRADVVVGNFNSSSIGVLLQNSSGTLDPMLVYPTSNSYVVKIGDFNGDGRMDIVGINWGSRGDGVDVYLQTDTGTLATPVIYHVQHGGWDDLDVGDVNGDGRTDIVVMSGQSFLPNLGILVQNTDGTMAAPVYDSIGSNILTRGVAVGDTDEDGLSDVVVSYGGNRPTSFIGRFLQNESGTLDPIASYASLDIPSAIVLADVDADGRKDVLVTHDGWVRMGVYRQTSAGDFATEELYPIPGSSVHYGPQGLAVGDINGDTLPDAVIADPNVGLVVLRHVDDVSPVVAVTAPAGGVYTAGVPIAIAWTASDNATLARFDVAASFDGGASYATIAGCTALPGAARACTWTSPGPAGAGVRLRVTARDAAGNQTAAETTIELASPSLTVTAPAAATTLYAGAPAAVTWTSNLPASTTLRVELSRDGGAAFETLAAAAPNTGSFAWTVTGPDTTTALVRVTSSSPAVSGTSGAFSIVTPIVAVASPVAGTTAFTGTAVAITWTTNLPVATALIELSRDGGASYETLAAAAPNTGAFAWLASGPDTAAAVARVTLNGPPVISGVSGLFAVVTAAVTVTSPAAGASFFAGTAQSISWSTNLPASAVMNIELSRDGGGTFETLAAGAPNTGSFAWTVTGSGHGDRPRARQQQQSGGQRAAPAACSASSRRSWR